MTNNVAANETVVLVTGANTGLGYEIVKSLLKSSARTYHVLLGSRSLDKGNAAADKIKSELSTAANTDSRVSVVQIDIEDDESIQRCFETVSGLTGCIDVLVNNAGASLDMAYLGGQLSLRQAWNQGWNVNVTSTYVFTMAMMPLLCKSKQQEPRLLLITSGTSSLEEASRGLPYTAIKPEAGWPKPTPKWSFTSYRCQKAGLNMLLCDLKREFHNDPIKIFAISPGFLATNLGGTGPEQLKKMGAKEPWEGGDFTRDVIEGKRDSDEGKVIRFDGIQPW